MNTRYRNGILEEEVIVRSIVRNGKRIYPKKAEAFRFWVPVDKKKR